MKAKRKPKQAEDRDDEKQGEVPATKPQKAKKAKKSSKMKPESLVGKRIRVKWGMEGGGFQWYEGRVMKYDATRQHHLVVYDGSDSTPYAINLTEPAQAEFVPKKNWKLT